MSSRQFRGKYLGGHVKFHDERKILLEVEDNTVEFYDDYLAYSWGLIKPEAFLSIPYERIANLQVISSDKIDKLRAVLIGPLAALLWRKKELVLVISFRDEIGFEQTLVFNVGDNFGAQRVIYDKVVEVKKKV
jgi:hypothetical protein